MRSSRFRPTRSAVSARESTYEYRSAVGGRQSPRDSPATRHALATLSVHDRACRVHQHLPGCPKSSANVHRGWSDRSRRTSRSRPLRRDQALRRDDRGRRRDDHRRAGRVLFDARPVRMWQDHLAADDCGIRRARLRSRRADGPRHRRRRTLQAQRQHGLPVVRAVPAPHRRRQRRVRPAAQEGLQERHPRPGRSATSSSSS